MKHLLITGAYGLVGSNICKILERDYPDINIKKVKCDDLFPITERFDYIIHAAGYGQPAKFSNDKIETIRINTELINYLLKNYLEYDGKFLYISSSEIYSGAPSPHKETDIGTTTPQHPRACYIEGKRCGEAICMAYKEQGYDVKIARLALAYGPGTKKGDTRVLNQFIEQALTTGNIKMRNTGSSYRTYLYVEDAAQIMLDILFEGEDVVYNVGGISTLRICDLAEKIAEITGSNWEMGNESIIPDSITVGAPDEVKLDVNKIMHEFPSRFSSMVSLGEGLKRTIEYQKQLYGI